jgi:hypothetical protein
MAVINYEQNAKYFRPVSYKAGVILAIVGLLFLFTGLSSGNAGPILLGLVVAGIGAFLISRQVSGRPSDGEIDRQCGAVMSEIVGRALRKLGLDLDEVKLIDPIVVGGYFLGSLGTPSRVKKGKDGRIRISNFEIVVLFFGEQELHAYKYQISLIADEGGEHTDVYFYRDVVSVSTNSSSRSVSVVGETKPEVWRSEVFTLTTSGGTAVECSMSATDETATRAIQAARQLVRNKKMHTT